MELSPIVQSFVLHFGEMGSRWGINRTVGQIYALLYISPEPLCADQIVDALGVSRSNVSMGIRELQGWNLVLLKHIPVIVVISSRRPTMCGRFCVRSLRSARNARSIRRSPFCAKS